MGHVKSGDESGHFCILGDIQKDYSLFSFHRTWVAAKKRRSESVSVPKYGNSVKIQQNDHDDEGLLLLLKFWGSSGLVVSTLTFSIWIYLPFDVCSLHIVDIVMFGSARWPSSQCSFWFLAWKYRGHLHFSLASFSFFARLAKDWLDGY